MPMGEIVWRVRSKLTEAADRATYKSRQRPLPLSTIANNTPPGGMIDPRVFGTHLQAIDPTAPEILDTWRASTTTAADKLIAHQLTLFDLEDHDLGQRINWNYEYKAHRDMPTGFAPGIDYRDHDLTGDCKFAWEPSRHHHLVTLGRAYRLSGDERYAEEALNQLDSWIDQCPFGTGMQWRSPLELGIRLINWAWTVELVRESSAFTDERVERIFPVAYRHLWDVSRKYSQFSSANNHLIGEAAGVFIGSSYFSGFRDAARWRSESREILLREILEQTYMDGGNREQAFGYHLFVLQFFLLTGLAARNCGDPLIPEFWGRLEKMFEFLARLIQAGSTPAYGDCDDGYVLNLGARLGDPRTLMGVGALLFDRGDFKALAAEDSEPLYWLFGSNASQRLASISTDDGDDELRSHSFPNSGHYLLQRGKRDADDRVSVLFDCGELGFKSIAAHGHADALSFTLSVGGVDVFVDPGTYDYFSFKGWRNYFRSTAAHNTVQVDALDQSELLGPFMWGRRAHTTCLRWLPTPSGGLVCGEHDGYRRLADPVRHRRTLELTDKTPELRIQDEIVARGAHTISQHFHLAPHCRVRSADDCRLIVEFGHGRIELELDPRVSVSVVEGSESPKLGWTSDGYHRKRPSPTVVARYRSDGPVTLHTRITLSPTLSVPPRDTVAAEGVARSESSA